MASSSTGTSSSLSMFPTSGFEEHLQALMDLKKRKRMMLNRESARRSRVRKQKHLEELMTEVTQLRNENLQILKLATITSQHYLKVEAENSIIRAQVNELSNSLQSWNEIINFLNFANVVVMDAAESNPLQLESAASDHLSFFNPVSMAYMNQTIMSAADMSLF